ncbi:MAG: thioesterase family protein [Crocinitomicaceae bacterium]|nr:thioesterase family protein [Crocinitomicaceae bacterium]
MINPTRIQVRFVDVDMMSHVNNAVYLSYFEYARMDFFTQLLGEGWDWQKDGIILLKNEIEYLKPVLLEDNPVIEIDVQKVGNKSFTLGYRLTVRDEVYCQGLSILVAYDYTVGGAQVIPEKLRSKLVGRKEEQ